MVKQTQSIFKNRLLISSCILSIAAVSAPMTATAQSAAETVSSDDEIIVTATRREESVIEVPLAVSVVDTEETLKSGITDISGIADLVPGLQSTDGGGPSLGNLVIRGVYAGGAPTVGTYIDDVPYGGVVGGFASSLALDASLYDLENIEISKGPQGTLFGSGAVGGVVRYVTQKPNLEEFEGYGFLDVSTIKEGGSSTLVKGRVSAPIAEGRLAVSASGYYEDAGGYVDLADLVNGGIAQEDVNDHEFWGGQLMAKAVLSDKITLVGSFAHHEADFDSAGYESFDVTTGAPLFGDLVTEFEAPRTLDFNLYSLTADVDLGFATLTSVTSQQDAELTNVTDLTAAFGPTADFLAPGGAPHNVSFSSGDDSKRFTQEVRLTSQSEGPIEWIVGAYYTKQDSNTFQITDVTPNDVELITLNNNLIYKEFALFGNVTYNITDRWDVTGGIRHSDNETSFDQVFTGALSNPVLNDLITDNDDKVTTWLFNTSYGLSESMNVYGRIASGYRPGGSNLVVTLPGVGTFGSPSYVPDDLWSYEGGIKGRLGQSNLTYDIAAYFIDWNDAQVTFTNPLGLSENGNAANGISAKGIEASLSGELFDNFVVSGTFALTDAELDGDEPLIGGVEGDEIPGNPKTTLSLAGDYNFALSSQFDASVGATFRHTGSYVSNFSASPLGFFDNDAYSQFDVRAGISKDNISFNAYVTNLGNSSAYQTVFHTTTPPLGYGVVLRPRTFGANIRVDF